MATPKKTYSNEELNALVAEFSAEFDALVKAEVAKTGQTLAKSEPLAKEEGGDDKEPKKDGPPSDSGSDSGGSDSGGGDAPPAPDASASAPAAPAPDASASAPASPAPDASASADPAAQAAGSDPMAALTQAYAQLSPDELAMHFQALKQVLMTQQAGSMGGAPGAGAAPAGADPMAGSAGAPPAAAPAPAGPGAGAPPPAAGGAPGADAVAPLAGEGSKPVDPAAMMALKSEHDKAMTLVKSERDAQAAKVAELEKSLAKLTETLEKVVAQPIRKSVTGKDMIDEVLSHEKPEPKKLTKAEITAKLLKAARDTATKPADRELINNYYKGTASVDALAHLLS